MYQNNNDDRSQYEYHYNYRPNYSEPIQTSEPVMEFTETKKHGRGKRIVAGILAGIIKTLCMRNKQKKEASK